MTLKHPAIYLAVMVLAGQALAEDQSVWLEDMDGSRLRIATLSTSSDGRYRLEMQSDAFTERFLSMRPFKCLDGPEKQWCHVPYPYEIRRDVSDGVTDLEYDLLFVWKANGDWGIDMWNGVYYRIEPTADGYVGELHELDLEKLAVPPPKGELRPIRDVDLERGDPDSHWLPRLFIE